MNNFIATFTVAWQTVDGVTFGCIVNDEGNVISPNFKAVRSQDCWDWTDGTDFMQVIDMDGNVQTVDVFTGQFV
jgi:hypothetical protein